MATDDASFGGSCQRLCQTAAKKPSVPMPMRPQAQEGPRDQRAGALDPRRLPAPAAPAAARNRRHAPAVKASRHVLVLGRQQAAGGVDQAPARLEQARRRRPGSPPAWPAARPPTSATGATSGRGCGAACPGPSTGASTSTRSILPARRLMRSSRSWAICAGCTLDRPLRASRGLSASSRWPETSKAYRRPVLRIAAPSASVLPPAPAQKSTTISPRLASVSSASSWLPSSCTSKLAAR